MTALASHSNKSHLGPYARGRHPLHYIAFLVLSLGVFAGIMYWFSGFIANTQDGMVTRMGGSALPLIKAPVVAKQIGDRVVVYAVLHQQAKFENEPASDAPRVVEIDTPAGKVIESRSRTIGAAWGDTTLIRVIDAKTGSTVNLSNLDGRSKIQASQVTVEGDIAYAAR